MNASKINKFAGALLSALVLVNVNHLYSQDWSNTLIKQQQRVDLRDLGYEKVNEIPVNSSSVTSLLTAGME